MSSISRVNVSVRQWVKSGGGFYDPQFERVAEEFVRNFQERDEVGHRSASSWRAKRWWTCGWHSPPRDPGTLGRDTILVMWSATKGATALCAHILVSRGLLDLDLQ